MKKELMLILLLLPFVEAVQIDMVYYNPVNETGSEFILLYNDQNQLVDLTGWRIATPTSPQDATLVGVIGANQTYLLADAGWEQGKDDVSWPVAQHEEALTLPNTNGYVQLIDSLGIVRSTVGYGEIEVYEGNPHPGAEQSQALVRVNATGNNQEDFVVSEPVFFVQTETNQTTQLVVEVQNHPSMITSIKIEDDSVEEGVQIIPLPGEERSIQVNVTVQDNNSLQNTSVFVNQQEFTIVETTVQQAMYVGSIGIEMNTTQIIVSVGDGLTSEEEIIPIEFLEVIGIRIPEEIQLQMQPGQEQNTTLLVENTGNTNVSLQIKGLQPAGIQGILGTIEYAILGERYLLGETFLTHTIGLEPQQDIQMDLFVEAGFVPSGTYTGQIIIAGALA